MTITSESINFKYVDTDPNSVLQLIYTVPASKVAKIRIDYINILIAITTTDSGFPVIFRQHLELGDMIFEATYVSGVISSNLSGRLFPTKELKRGLAAWPIEGESIKPIRDPIYIQSVGGYEELTRLISGNGGSAESPDVIPRTVFLDAGDRIRYSLHLPDSVDISSRKVVMHFSAEAILEDK